MVDFFYFPPKLCLEQGLWVKNEGAQTVRKGELSGGRGSTIYLNKTDACSPHQSWNRNLPAPSSNVRSRVPTQLIGTWSVNVVGWLQLPEMHVLLL